MATKMRVNMPSFSLHLQTCRLHDEETPPTCAGYVRNGKSQCSKKASIQEPNTLPDMLPTCKLHRDQLIVSTQCGMTMPCGFECAKLCEWVPHSFSRCQGHMDYPAGCYFLDRVPLELRLRIYGYLLPDRDLMTGVSKPKQFGNRGHLRNRPAPDRMSILVVNRQIHDEATDLLYGTGMFNVLLEDWGTSMCNSMPMTGLATLPGSRRSNHALQDYQMQLMLLEQQNKNRLLMARQEQDNMTTARGNQVPAASSSSNSGYIKWGIHSMTSNLKSTTGNVRTDIGGIGKSVVDEVPLYPPTPPEAMWDAPIAPRYFDLIQSFRVTISFHASNPGHRVMPLSFHRPNSSNSEEEINKKYQLYDYSDQLHKIVSRLQATQRRIYRLEIWIKFEQDRNRASDEETLKVLLRPFERLCNVPDVSILGWGWDSDPVDKMTNLSHALAPSTMASYISDWTRSLSSPAPRLAHTAAFETYWSLERMLVKITRHCHEPSSKINPELKKGFEKFSDLRHQARICREGDDLEGLRTIFAGVLAVWYAYLEWEREFQNEMTKEIEGLWGAVGGTGG
jgi:hypothetical protein